MLQPPRGPTIRRVIAIAIATSLWSAPALAEDDAKAFTCCKDSRITKIVEAYLGVHEALVEDPSDKRTRDAMKHLVPVLRDKSGLATPDRNAVAALAKLVDAARNKSASAIREAFDPISRQVIFLALRHQGGNVTIAEAWCPRVGPWLQADTEAIASPYGDTCGRWR